MSVLDGPGEGTWSVFAQKVVEERDRAIEERDEALRLLATRVEAKRLDAAQEEIADLRLAAEQMVAELRAVLESPTLLEALAAIEHERWSRPTSHAATTATRSA